MRNYRFAILQYDPANEFEVQEATQRLFSELKAHGWEVLSIDLQQLLLRRIRNMGEDWSMRVIEREKRLSKSSPQRALNFVRDKVSPLIDGPDGIAADCSAAIVEQVDREPEKVDRTLAIIGRAGSLYPFFRSSALLRDLDGRTKNVPVVLLYPGQRHGSTTLSFMGELEPDSDYRPRIYPQQGMP